MGKGFGGRRTVLGKENAICKFIKDGIGKVVSCIVEVMNRGREYCEDLLNLRDDSEEVSYRRGKGVHTHRHAHRRKEIGDVNEEYAKEGVGGLGVV